MASKSSLHNPMTIGLFAAGLGTETLLSSLVGHALLLNMSVVLATAVYFYMIDDIAALVRKVSKWK